MKQKDRRFRIVDGLLLLGMILPVVCGMVLKVLTNPPSEGISVNGAGVFFEIPFPIQPFAVSESQVNSVIVLITLFFLCRYITHGIRAGVATRRQVFAEWAVEQCEKLVDVNMGEFFKGFAPFIAAILGLSAFSSLLTLVGLFPPTSDINVTAGWAILVFILITYYKMKGGFGHYLKSFAEPVAFLTPLNIIGEVATPISMAFRHYGNVLSGSVIGVLIAAALQGLTQMLLGWLPGFLGDIPFLQVGLPAVLSIYFDIFSGGLQAFIFAMLTMLYIAGAFSPEAYLAKQQKKNKRKNKTEV